MCWSFKHTCIHINFVKTELFEFISHSLKKRLATSHSFLSSRCFYNKIDFKLEIERYCIRFRYLVLYSQPFNVFLKHGLQNYTMFSKQYNDNVDSFKHVRQIVLYNDMTVMFYIANSIIYFGEILIMHSCNKYTVSKFIGLFIFISTKTLTIKQYFKTDKPNARGRSMVERDYVLVVEPLPMILYLKLPQVYVGFLSNNEN